jgi:Leucine-rich repeat (LRR) protein
MNALANLIGHDSTPLARLDLREQTDGEPLDISSFSKAMHANATIDTLRLSNNQLQDDQVIELIAHIKDNDTIQELDLQYNQITEVGLNYLTEHLNGMKSLAVLLLGGNAFGSDGQNILENLQDHDGSICTVSEKGISSKRSSSNKQQTKKHSSPTKGKGFSAGGLFSGFGGGGNSKRIGRVKEEQQPR